MEVQAGGKQVASADGQGLAESVFSGCACVMSQLNEVLRTMCKPSLPLHGCVIVLKLIYRSVWVCFFNYNLR